MTEVFPDIALSLVVFAWVATFVAVSMKHKILGMFSGLALGISGVNILINGLVGTTNFLVEAFGGVSLGFGFFVFIFCGIQLIKGED